jgi:hypothetical protein
VLANFGLAFLFFLAGFEIDFPAIRGRPTVLAALGWLASLLVCLGVLLLVVRGLFALPVRRELDLRSRIVLGLFSATQLPLVVAIAAIGVKSGRPKPDTAASLVGAGMASVRLFPVATLVPVGADGPRRSRRAKRPASRLPPRPPSARRPSRTGLDATTCDLRPAGTRRAAD